VLDPSSLISRLPGGLVSAYLLGSKRIYYVRGEAANPNWSWGSLERARAYSAAVRHAEEKVRATLDFMASDEMVRAFFLLNPVALTELFVYYARAANPRETEETLLRPFSSVSTLRPGVMLLERLALGSVKPNEMVSARYRTPPWDFRRENTQRGLGIWTVILQEALGTMLGRVREDRAQTLDSRLVFYFRGDDPRSASEEIGEVSAEDVATLLHRLSVEGLVTEVEPGLYAVNRHILELWNRGMILQLFVKRALERTISPEGIVWDVLVLAYPTLAENTPGTDYDRLRGLHEIGILAQDRMGSPVIVEPRNTPLKTELTYPEVTQFLGKAGSVESYYGVRAKKAVVTTSKPSQDLGWVRARPDLFISDRTDLMSNLPGLLKYVSGTG
jgi:hypothetical protein